MKTNNEIIDMLRKHGWSLDHCMYFGGYSIIICSKDDRQVIISHKDNERRMIGVRPRKK